MTFGLGSKWAERLGCDACRLWVARSGQCVSGAPILLPIGCTVDGSMLIDEFHCSQKECEHTTSLGHRNLLPDHCDLSVCGHWTDRKSWQMKKKNTKHTVSTMGSRFSNIILITLWTHTAPGTSAIEVVEVLRILLPDLPLASSAN